jgi:hypothetical protein
MLPRAGWLALLPLFAAPALLSALDDDKHRVVVSSSQSIFGRFGNEIRLRGSRRDPLIP